MKLKNLFKSLLGCVLVICMLTITAGAAEKNEVVPLESLPSDVVDLSLMESLDNVTVRALGTIDTKIAPNTAAKSDTSFSLESGETVTIECTYSPASASVDFGLIAPNGRFYYKNSTTGSIDTTMKISERGYYTLAVRNNSSKSVTVLGSVDY